MKVLVKSSFEVMRVLEKGVVDARVAEYTDKKGKIKKGILIYDTSSEMNKFIREVCGELRCALEIDNESEINNTLNFLDDSKFSLENYIYVVTEKNTYAIKEDLKKAGAKWDAISSIWYFEKENNTFKNEKVYII
jgi:hypothetical protein